MRLRVIEPIVAGAARIEVSRRLARRPQVGRVEEHVFRAANDASDRIRMPVRAVMQAGTFATVSPAAGAALALGRLPAPTRSADMLGELIRDLDARVTDDV